MKRIQREQAPQKSKIDQPAVTGIPIQRKLPDQKIGALPANDVRVRYQPMPVSPNGIGVIQCCGFFGCCDDVSDMETPADVYEPLVGQEPTDDMPVTGQQQPESPRKDGPCAVYAIYSLGWEPGYTEENGFNENRVQNSEFGALGTEMATGYQLSELQDKQVLVEFFNYEKDGQGKDAGAFHVMFTDGNGHLRGKNNDPFMLNRVLGTPVRATVRDDAGFIKYVTNILKRVLGMPVSTEEPVFVTNPATGDCIIKMNDLTIHDDADGYVRCIKYVTKEEYLSNTPRLKNGTNL